MLLTIHLTQTKWINIQYIFIAVFACSIMNTFAQEARKDSLNKRLLALKTASNYTKDTAYINTLYNLGRELRTFNLDSLLIVAKEGLSLSKSINYVDGEALSLLNIGVYHSESGHHKEAILFFLQSIEKSKSINNVRYLLRAKNFLAMEYEFNNENAKALREYLEAIEIAKETKNYHWLSILYVDISNLYGDQGNTDQSIQYLKLAKDNNKFVKDDYVKGLTLSNLTAGYLKINKLDSARVYADQSVAIFENINMESWQAYAYELKARIYTKQNLPKLALYWFKKSEEIHKIIDQTRYKIPLFNGMAGVYLKLEDYKKAETYALKALKISKNLNLLDQRDISLQLLYDINKTVNEPLKALAYLEELKITSDSLSAIKNEKELQILKFELEFEQEKERYLAENNKKIAEQKSYFYVVLFILLMAVLIIFILRKNNKAQNKLNQELIIKSEELKKKEAFLANANNTKSRLFSIIAHDLKGPVKSVNSVFDLLDSGNMDLEEIQEMTPLLKKNMNGVSSVLNNLLSWGQSQMNELITEPEVTKMHSLALQNINFLSKTAAQKSISMINEIAEEVLTWSDKNQIDIVIRNLLSNAIKFTPNGGKITIGALEKKTHWEFYLRDTGVGMTQDAIDKIFEKQKTFTTYGTNNEKGTGLGLILCKEMIENNGGTIWSESKVNAGTCFYFTHPKYTKNTFGKFSSSTKVDKSLKQPIPKETI